LNAPSTKTLFLFSVLASLAAVLIASTWLERLRA
jgi:hypothetical protein